MYCNQKDGNLRSESVSIHCLDHRQSTGKDMNASPTRKSWDAHGIKMSSLKKTAVKKRVPLTSLSSNFKSMQ